MLEHVSPKSAVDVDFENFYLQSFRKVVAVLLRSGAGIDDAQDIAQEAMLATYRNWPGITHPTAYAVKVATRTFLGEQGRRREHQAAVQRAGNAQERFDEVQPDTSREVLDLLKALGPMQRTVMALAVDGFSPAEIADIIGKSVATVRSNLRHARTNLSRTVRDMHAARKETDDGS